MRAPIPHLTARASTLLPTREPLLSTAARQITDSDRGSLFLVDARTRQLYTKMADGVTEIRIPMKQGVAGWAASRSEIVNIKDAYQVRGSRAGVWTRTGTPGTRCQRSALIVALQS